VEYTTEVEDNVVNLRSLMLTTQSNTPHLGQNAPTGCMAE
jgi:hypothetical protein